jgi:uncharacterized membrane protein YccC
MVAPLLLRAGVCCQLPRRLLHAFAMTQAVYRVGYRYAEPTVPTHIRELRMHLGATWKTLSAQCRVYRAPLGFGIRVTLAAISALLIAQFFALPLHGLWVVLTATVVTQLSVGGSLRAGLEYVLGTLGGAVYAGIVGVLVAPANVLTQSAVLAITVAPLAFLAALNPNFRVAPFSAVLVLLIAGQLGEGPIESALTRLLEVTLGGAVAVIVSFLVFPERTHRLAGEAAGRALDEMAKDIPDILMGFFQEADPAELLRIQDRVGASVAELQGIVEEFKHERPLSFTSAPDPAPLPRTLLRLRHDLVIMGRASAEPLPTHLREDLRPALDRVGIALANYFRGCALALAPGHKAVDLRPPQEALDACASELVAFRQRDLAQLSASQLEQLFALGFALEQLQRNTNDLERCVRDWANSPGKSTT